LRQTLQSGDLAFQRERLLQDQSEGSLERQLRSGMQATDINFQRERMVLERIIADAIAAGKLQGSSTLNLSGILGGGSGSGSGSGGGVDERNRI
jgi:hypothetical protein